MSWGLKITMVYSGFVALIVTMVAISFNNKSELVAKDYYAQELSYQERINAVRNESGLAVSIMHTVEQQRVVLFYPAGERGSDFTGEAVFFRPSDSTKDLKLKLQFDETGQMFVSKSVLTKGIYKLCLSWTNNGVKYYREEVITI